MGSSTSLRGLIPRHNCRQDHSSLLVSLQGASMGEGATGLIRRYVESWCFVAGLPTGPHPISLGLAIEGRRWESRWPKSGVKRTQAPPPKLLEIFHPVWLTHRLQTPPSTTHATYHLPSTATICSSQESMPRCMPSKVCGRSDCTYACRS
ncbi:hypothetical protein BC567DRAFT_238070 [Phyllosticta citribraziliensis]